MEQIASPDLKQLLNQTFDDQDREVINTELDRRANLSPKEYWLEAAERQQAAINAQAEFADMPQLERLKAMWEKYEPDVRQAMEDIDGLSTEIHTKAIPDEAPYSFKQSEIDSQYSYYKDAYHYKYTDDAIKEEIEEKAKEIAEEEGPSVEEVARDYVANVTWMASVAGVNDAHITELVINDLAGEPGWTDNVTPESIATVLEHRGMPNVTPDDLDRIRAVPFNPLTESVEEAGADWEQYIEKAQGGLIEEHITDWLDNGGVQDAWENAEHEIKEYYADSSGVDVIVDTKAVTFEGQGKISNRVYEHSHAAAQLLAERYSALASIDEFGSEDAAPAIEERVPQLFQGWVASSTSREGKLLMAAARDELGAQGNGYVRGYDADEASMKDAVPAESGKQDRGAVRTSWLVAQTLLENDGVEYVDLYRGLKIKDWKGATSRIQKEGMVRNMDIKPSLLQSATTQVSTARSFGNVVVRMRVPRELILSVPAQGKNEHEEEEYIVMGGDWVNYDVWLASDVPHEDEFNFAKERKPVLKSEQRRVVIIPPTSFTEERRKQRLDDQLAASLDAFYLDHLVKHRPHHTGTSQKVHGNRGSAGGKLPEKGFGEGDESEEIEKRQAEIDKLALKLPRLRERLDQLFDDETSAYEEYINQNDPDTWQESRVRESWRDTINKASRDYYGTKEQIEALEKEIAQLHVAHVPTEAEFSDRKNIFDGMDYKEAVEKLGQDEVDQRMRTVSRLENEWERRVEYDLSLGRYTHEQAAEIGYRRSDGRKWAALPSDLWHVTTAGSAVAKEGLKTRDELGQAHGKGLGGGEDDTISYTESPKMAEGIYGAMHEARAVAAGEIQIQDMIQAAKEGAGAETRYLRRLMHWWNPKWDYGDPYPQPVQDMLAGRGQEYNEETLRYETTEVATPERKQADQFDFFHKFSLSRQDAGGHDYPWFVSSDVAGLGEVDPAEIKIVKVQANPGAQGYQLRALGEWRTTTGDNVEISEIADSALDQRLHQKPITFSDTRQLTDQLDARGGFTYNPVNDTSDIAGYSVAMHPDNEQQHKIEDITPDVLFAYMLKHRELLKTDDRVRVGAWYNKADGMVYLDTPTIITDRDQAERFARNNGQLAIYELHTGTEIETLTADERKRWQEEQIAKTKSLCSAPRLHSRRNAASVNRLVCLYNGQAANSAGIGDAGRSSERRLGQPVRSVDSFYKHLPQLYKHYGPGEHPGTGTPQSVHAGRATTDELAQIIYGGDTESVMYQQAAAELRRRGLNPNEMAAAITSELNPSIAFAPPDYSDEPWYMRPMEEVAEQWGMSQEYIEHERRWDIHTFNGMIVGDETWFYPDDAMEHDYVFRTMFPNYKAPPGEYINWGINTGDIITFRMQTDHLWIRASRMDQGIIDRLWDLSTKIPEWARQKPVDIYLEPRGVHHFTERIELDNLTPASLHELSDRYQKSAVRDLESLYKHFGPGEHPGTRSPQTAHAGKRGKVTDTPEFKRWFGDSKIVDADGNPKKLYHASPNQFTEFNDDGFGIHVGTAAQATERLKWLETGGGKNQKLNASVFALYVKAENPLRLKDHGTWDVGSPMSTLSDELIEKNIITQDELTRIKKNRNNEWRKLKQKFYVEDKFLMPSHWKQLKPGVKYADFRKAELALDAEVTLWGKNKIAEAGYDSIVYSNKFEGGGDSFIVWDSNQLKSATGNSGAFDPDNPDITKSLGLTTGFMINPDRLVETTHDLYEHKYKVLPTPNENETEQDFIARFMSDDQMEAEFPDHKQRVAVAYSQYRTKTKLKHYGPGVHPGTGTPQQVHAGGIRPIAERIADLRRMTADEFEQFYDNLGVAGEDREFLAAVEAEYDRRLHGEQYAAAAGEVELESRELAERAISPHDYVAANRDLMRQAYGQLDDDELVTYLLNDYGGYQMWRDEGGKEYEQLEMMLGDHGPSALHEDALLALNYQEPQRISRRPPWERDGAIEDWSDQALRERGAHIARILSEDTMAEETIRNLSAQQGVIVLEQERRGLPTRTMTADDWQHSMDSVRDMEQAGELHSEYAQELFDTYRARREAARPVEQQQLPFMERRDRMRERVQAMSDTELSQALYRVVPVDDATHIYIDELQREQDRRQPDTPAARESLYDRSQQEFAWKEAWDERRRKRRGRWADFVKPDPAIDVDYHPGQNEVSVDFPVQSEAGGTRTFTATLTRSKHADITRMVTKAIPDIDVYEFIFEDEFGSTGLTGAGDAKNAMVGASRAMAEALREIGPGAVFYSSEGIGRTGMYQFLTERVARHFDGYVGVTLKTTDGSEMFTNSDGEQIIKQGKSYGKFAIVRRDVLEAAKAAGVHYDEIATFLAELEAIHDDD